jgi:hypothetical protein
VEFGLSSGSGSGASLSVYDLSGRRVARIGGPGSREGLSWDCRDGDGRRVASGIYICVLERGGQEGIAARLVIAR